MSFEQLGDSEQEQDDDDVDEIEKSVDPLPPHMKSFKEAMLALEDINQVW